MGSIRRQSDDAVHNGAAGTPLMGACRARRLTWLLSVITPVLPAT